MTENTIKIPDTSLTADNFISGTWHAGSGEIIEVTSPYTGEKLGSLQSSTSQDVDHAIQAAATAQKTWGKTPLKERCQVMFRFRELLYRDIDLICNIISSENGKTLSESRAGVMKGIEVLEYALALQNIDDTSKMIVSRGVSCEYRREALGVVAGITPFNFPAMVPMWMIPIAITTGNAFVWKPSEKTPFTSILIGDLIKEAGLPDGILTIVQGSKETVGSILDHQLIKAVGFVGSTKVAKSIYAQASSNGKRVLALGGAKNHIFLLPDANHDLAIKGIRDSYTGCAGQRCMAASVLLAVGSTDSQIDSIVKSSQEIVLGENMGAIITKEQKEFLYEAIEKALAKGAKLILDGRKLPPPEKYKNGFWLGPTILDHVTPQSMAATTELFGPILSIIRCDNIDQAIKIENANPYGNAASVFTNNGALAEQIVSRAKAGMVGINVGVPVPREPFSFGGTNNSRFGHGDITGPGGVEFWTQLKKLTIKWLPQKDENWMA